MSNRTPSNNIQFLDIWYTNIKCYHVVFSIVETIIELLYFVFCVIKTIDVYYTGSFSYIVYAICCILNLIIFILSVTSTVRDIHFLNMGNIQHYVYLSYLKINASSIFYILRYLLSGYFFSEEDDFSIFLGFFPTGIYLLEKFFDIISNKHKCNHIGVRLNENTILNNSRSDNKKKLTEYLHNNKVIKITQDFLNDNKINECVICLNDFLETHTIRKLDCGHVFHSNCIEEWLNINIICPVCKQNVISAENYHNINHNVNDDVI